MSTTPFTTVYPYARTLLGDLDTIAPIWSDDQLDLGIRVGLLQEESYSEVATVSASGDREITPALATKGDLFRIALRTALGLLSPSMQEGSYRTPMLSVSRGRNLNYEDMQRSLQVLVDGGEATALSDSEFDQFIAGRTTVPAPAAAP